MPGLGPRAAYAQQAIREKLIEHRQYIARYGDDMPDIRDWAWSAEPIARARVHGPDARSRVKR